MYFRLDKNLRSSTFTILGEAIADVAPMVVLPGRPTTIGPSTATSVYAIRVAKAGDVHGDHFAPMGMRKRTAGLNGDAARHAMSTSVPIVTLA